MKAIFFRVFAAVLCAAIFTPAQHARAGEYDIDLSHSFIQFRTQHLGVSWLLGRFNEFSGEFAFDPDGGPGAQSVRVEVQTDSVDSAHAERDKHFRGRKFLNVDEFPTATFESTGYEGDANGGVMRGMFTLHGATRPVEVQVKKIGEGDDPWGGYRAGFEGKFSIKCSDYGINHGIPPSEEVHLEIYLEGIRR